MRENSLGGNTGHAHAEVQARANRDDAAKDRSRHRERKTPPQACKEAAITVQTFYRWRKEYGGLKLEQAKRMKDLEKENGRLKRLVAELSLEKQVLKDVASG